MGGDYADIFSPAELEYLKHGADSLGWYVWTDKTSEIIMGLCKRGLMAANGDFKVRGKEPGRLGDAASRQLSYEKTLLRYYELTDMGHAALQVLRRRCRTAAVSSGP